ncbi:hypothetical protein AMAG_12174 [Allomyces macrogynus ATCC 38327]|uniref:Uncharacterized protein n=1 Tax=Allomyces macrogynus (strain ATCC 38327) TaxID=578462 RepID=A0A0L0SX71_ALLM3|nr:hypothetical protein, variant [Allomyces macrogynus ATCC 38327]KNE67097.1 hypothetical protein AMAG_12174 [Allomyces macrogynus ATCC 38327]|eukprot:KNE67096.1 hypothetical protein, variant [Allomyces macrogynus ATCC 38327]
MADTTAPTAVDPTAQDSNPEASPTSFLGPDYELNPRYHDALAAYFEYIDLDHVGYLLPSNLVAEASKPGSSDVTLFSAPDLLREFYKAADIEFRDSDLGIGLAAYIKLWVITAQIEPESAWQDVLRAQERSAPRTGALKKLTRKDLPSGIVPLTPRAAKARKTLDEINDAVAKAVQKTLAKRSRWWRKFF